MSLKKAENTYMHTEIPVAGSSHLQFDFTGLQV